MLAKRLDHYLTSRDIRFTAYVYSVAYKEPSDSARWLQDDGDDLVSLPNPMAPAQMGRTKERFVTATVQPKTLAPSVSTVPKASLNEFLDALSSLFVRRKGLAEQELFELVTESLQVPGRYVWSLLRSWEEQGLFDRRFNVQWRSRVYFARKPLLHSFVEAGNTILVMTGFGSNLAGPAIRGNLQETWDSDVDSANTQRPCTYRSSCSVVVRRSRHSTCGRTPT